MEGDAHLVGEKGDGDVEQAQIDVLSLPPLVLRRIPLDERRQNGRSRVKTLWSGAMRIIPRVPKRAYASRRRRTCHDVHDGHADLHGMPLRIAGDGHQAGHALRGTKDPRERLARTGAEERGTCLQEEVVSGLILTRTRLPEPRDRAVDDGLRKRPR